jgi:hypothetical protein
VWARYTDGTGGAPEFFKFLMQLLRKFFEAGGDITTLNQLRK